MARMGLVVFSYDMVGYNDTNQFPHGDNPTALGGPREDLWNISVMGLQLWNSMRALDFLTTLPDVDSTRLAATGASGGGTQTFLLTATDDRIKVAAPVNMISAIMQGNGCEEAANLRVGAFNVMFGAMMAPRPLLMVSATGDWTVNTPTEEFPAVRGIYRLVGAEGNVEMVQIDQKHNYSKESREAVYTFFNARLLGGKGPVKEQRYRVEQLQDLLVLFEKNRPTDAVTMERYVNDRIGDARKGTDRLSPRDRDSLTKSRAAFHERLTFALLDVKPAPDQVTFEKTSTSPHQESLLLGRAGKGDRIPAVWLTPETANAAVAPTLIVHPEGVAWITRSSQSGLVKDILDRGGSVLAIDAFQTGAAKAPRERTKRAFTVFNQTDDANRVQDILTALSYLQSHSNAGHVNLVGLEMAGIWTYFARALAGEGVNLAADLIQFRADTDQEYLDRFYVPGLRKAGDFKAAAVVDTESKLLLYNVGREFPASWVAQSSRIANTVAAMHTSRVSDAELAAWVASR
jgi:dienelactone hydrolase